MRIIPGRSQGEDLFWAANFDKVLESKSDPIIMALAAVYAQADIGPFLEALPPSWMAFVLALSRIYGNRPDADLLLAEVEPSEHPFLSVMVPYCYGLLDWRAGVISRDCVAKYGMDVSSDFGRAMAMELQSWHSQIAEDFPAHLRGLSDSCMAFTECDPPAIYWAGKTLSLSLNLGAEMADHRIVTKMIPIADTFPWTRHQEHDRFNALLGTSLWYLLTGYTDEAVKYARHAKARLVPRCCTAHAMLWTASIATYNEYHIWATDQIQTAAEIYDVRSPGNCPDARSVVLSLALFFTGVDTAKAREYIAEFHLANAPPSSATSHDSRLNALADTTISRIASMNGEFDLARELALKAYDTLSRYGHVYRAAQASTAVAIASKGREADAWFMRAEDLLRKYSASSSDVLRYTINLHHHPSVHISERETEVLRAVQEGLTNKEIGNRLSFSPKTIECVVSSLLHKYSVHNRQALVQKTVLHGHRKM